MVTSGILALYFNAVLPCLAAAKPTHFGIIMRSHLDMLDLSFGQGWIGYTRLCQRWL